MLRKGAWTAEEDMLLKNYIKKYGEGKWHLVPLKAGLTRCRKSCRLRWLNYLRPNTKRGDFEDDEVDLMHRLHKLLGNRWSLIAGRLPGRISNDVKNYWNSHVVRSRSKKQKAQLKEGAGPLPIMVQVIKPQAVYSLPPPYSVFSGICFPTGLVSSPTVSDGQIQEYLNELYQDHDNEIADEVAGCSQGSFSAEGHDLHVFGKENHEIGLFNFSVHEGIWDQFLEL